MVGKVREDLKKFEKSGTKKKQQELIWDIPTPASNGFTGVGNKIQIQVLDNGAWEDSLRFYVAGYSN